MLSIRHQLAAFCVVASLVWAVTGTAAEDKAFRAARSVHLGYQAPEGRFFYSEVVVEKSVNGSYFMACGWNTGYFGIQQLDAPDDKVVLFSVWDPTTGDDPNVVKAKDRVEVLYQGEGVQIKRFGGEGTGGQCRMKYLWQIGQTNRFLLGAYVGGQKTAYTAWLWVEGAWKKLATFRTRTKLRRRSPRDWLILSPAWRSAKRAAEQLSVGFADGWTQLGSTCERLPPTWSCRAAGSRPRSVTSNHSSNIERFGAQAGAGFLATNA